MYVRHAAWLSAVPERAEGDKSKTPLISRREALENEGIEPDMPPLDWGDYLVGWLFEFGPTMVAGAGVGPLTATEIESWQRLLGVQFQPWETRLLRRLSAEYASESAQATTRDREPPFAESTDAQRLYQAEMNRKMDLFLS